MAISKKTQMRYFPNISGSEAAKIYNGYQSADQFECIASTLFKIHENSEGLAFYDMFIWMKQLKDLE
jgi:hypothetical protein